MKCVSHIYIKAWVQVSEHVRYLDMIFAEIHYTLLILVQFHNVVNIISVPSYLDDFVTKGNKMCNIILDVILA